MMHKMTIRTGTRSSKLALIQANSTLKKIAELLPELTFEIKEYSSPGDRDRHTDLRVSSSDFFTKDLDDAVLKGNIDCAIHSAKDLPDPIPEGMDWFWLPWHEEQRDALILPEGKSVDDLPEKPVAGISSDRREKWCLSRFPSAKIKSIRGNIEERLEQLDAGEYDLVIMASAAISRLGHQDRIAEMIPADELPVPPGQGFLAITFRSDNQLMKNIRSLFVKSVTFAGSGIGTEENTTLGTIRALKHCDVCLYDSLMPPELLNYLPKTAERIDAGKRCGEHHMDQNGINLKLQELARQGKRVVRLKGGDPTIFGRLAEETEALDTIQLPYRVLPGVSSLNTASASTGILLTRRGISRGFCVMTPRQKDEGLAAVNSEARCRLPIVFFMAAQVTGDIVEQLISEGLSPATPSALVYSAGTNEEETVRCRLSDLPAKAAAMEGSKQRPAILVIGDVSTFSFSSHGALRGRSILLTCSESLQEKASLITTDFGGKPVNLPLIRLSPSDQARERLADIANYDFLTLTSPSSVRCFADLIKQMKIDFRRIPFVMACGTGTANELLNCGIHPEIMPESEFSASGLMKAAKPFLKEKIRILRLRSDKAGPELAEELRAEGADVDDCVLYHNKPVHWDRLPEFDAVFFASASAVECFLDQWGPSALDGKTILAIGKPTAEALNKKCRGADVIGRKATVESAISTLAEHFIRSEIRRLTPTISKNRPESHAAS